MNYNIGDTVEVIDDTISGIVTHILGTEITIEDSNGFEFQFKAHQLILSVAVKDIVQSVYRSDINSIKKIKDPKAKRKIPTKSVNNRHTPKFEVDLHIHQLIDSAKNMTNFEILNLQLDTAKQQLEFAIKKRIPKLVFIHGIGKGVLRQELETLLRRYNNVTFYDADYKMYGLGATEVRIFQVS